MSKDRDDKLNRDAAPEGQFSLEDILAEFGGGSARRREEEDEATAVPAAPPGRAEKAAKKPEAPPSSAQPKRKSGVAAFPGAPRSHEPAAEPPKEKQPQAEPPRPDKPKADPPKPAKPKADKPPRAPRPQSESKPRDQVPPKGEGKVLEFREEEKKETFFTAKLGELRKKADEYADHMYENAGLEDRKDVRRAEKYIPGVDVEEEPTEPLRRERRPRRLPPPAPDYSPGELYSRYGRGLKLLWLRTALVFLLALPMLYLTVFQYMGAPLPGALAGSYERQVLTLAILMGSAMVLGIDQLILPFVRLARLHIGLDTLLTLACAATLADALTVVKLGGRDGQLPYCAVCVLGLAAAMLGTALKLRGQRSACRTAAAARQPYLVTLDENKWNGRDAYAKWSGEAAGFGSQIQADDGAQRIFNVAAPLLLIACVVFSILASVGRDRPERLLWCLSATLTAAATFSGTLCFGMPWASLSRRLSNSGAALAGWDGVAGAAGQVGILLTDADLFPPGAVTLNGIKVFGDFPVEKVVGCAATLIHRSGSGLDKPFHDLLRSQGAIYRRCEDFQYHEGGGLSADLRGERVLVGSASFMHLCEIPLPQGLNVKNAVFCAINGNLAGIFALNYALHSAVRPSLTALIRNRVGPVMATRDFNLTPAMLQQRFKLPVERMEYPAVERRVELSDDDSPHSDILSAVLCREGLFPFSEAVVGARRLYTAVRLSSSLAAAGGAVGAVLAFYLTFVEAFASLSPANLLVFLLMWTVPTLLISGWVERY